MAGSDLPSPLAVLGLTDRQERLYRALLRVPSMSPEAAAEVLGAHLDSATYAEAVDELMVRGLVLRAVDDLVAAPPERALARLVSDEHHRLQTQREQLAAVRGLLPALEAEHRLTRHARGENVSSRRSTATRSCRPCRRWRSRRRGSCAG